MEWYLNSAQYGDLIYGADAAAHAFFGKSATQLDLAEATMLVAISKTPAINPQTGSQYLKQQQEQIILAMLGNDFISLSDAQQAVFEQVNFHTVAEARVVCGGYLREYNHERPHSSLGYRTQSEFKQEWLERQSEATGL